MSTPQILTCSASSFFESEGLNPQDYKLSGCIYTESDEIRFGIARPRTLLNLYEEVRKDLAKSPRTVAITDAKIIETYVRFPSDKPDVVKATLYGTKVERRK